MLARAARRTIAAQRAAITACRAGQSPPAFLLACVRRPLATVRLEEEGHHVVDIDGYAADRGPPGQRHAAIASSSTTAGAGGDPPRHESPEGTQPDGYSNNEEGISLDESPFHRARQHPQGGDNRSGEHSSRGGREERVRGWGGRIATRAGGGSSKSRGRPRNNSSIEYVVLLGELKRTGNWISAIDEYKKASEAPGFCRVMYNATIATLSRSPRWRVALSVYQEMKEAGHTPDAYSFNAAIQACVHGREEALAFDLFAEMPAAGVTPDAFTYNHLISSCGAAGKWETALQLVQDMDKSGLRVNSMTYNATIVACGNAGKPEVAVGLLDEMREKGVQVTEGSFSAAIAACGKAGQWERALLLLDEMKQGRDNLEPNEYCYNSGICACERSARWREALDLLRQMQSADLIVNSAVYTHVIKACTNAGEFSQAESLMDEMREAGVYVKSGTKALVTKQRERRRGQTSRKDFRSPTANYGRTQDDCNAGFGVEPVFLAREDVGIAATGESSPMGEENIAFPRETGEAWEERSQDANGDSASAVHTTGQKTTRESAERRVVSTRMSANAFLRCVGVHARHQRWPEIVRELDEAIANPNTKVSRRMYEGCIAGLSIGGRWTEAIGVLEKLQTAGLTPDSRCVTAAIRACARSDPPRWGIAVSLLQGLKKPEVWAYVATLSALAKAGQYKKSESLLEEMPSAGVQPNLYCYNSTLAAFKKANPPQWQKAVALLAQMKEDDALTPNLISYTTAVQACLAASESAAAESLVKEMVLAGYPPADELKSLVAVCASVS